MPRHASGTRKIFLNDNPALKKRLRELISAKGKEALHMLAEEVVESVLLEMVLPRLQEAIKSPQKGDTKELQRLAEVLAASPMAKKPVPPSVAPFSLIRELLGNPKTPLELIWALIGLVGIAAVG